MTGFNGISARIGLEDEFLLSKYVTVDLVTLNDCGSRDEGNMLLRIMKGSRLVPNMDEASEFDGSSSDEIESISCSSTIDFDQISRKIGDTGVFGTVLGAIVLVAMV
jgi:hypothetical protein